MLLAPKKAPVTTVLKHLAGMRNQRLLILALSAAAAVAGCVTEPELGRSPIRVGMPREDLRFFFGEPLRIERTDSGGEDWFYRFESSSTPQMDGAVSHDVADGSDSVWVSMSPSSKGKEERPIHLSVDGRVIEPIPEGKILGR